MIQYNQIDNMQLNDFMFHLKYKSKMMNSISNNIDDIIFDDLEKQIGNNIQTIFNVFEDSHNKQHYFT